jgi:hypothetical protein
MKLCQHCGVELEAAARRCPLCRRSWPDGADMRAADAPPSPQAPPVVRRRLHRWWLEIFALLAGAAIIVVYAIDLASGMTVTWAHLPAAALAFAWLVGFILVVAAGRPWAILPAEVAAVSLFLWCLDGFTPGADWFVPLALPLTVLAGAIAAAALALVRLLAPSPFTIVALALVAAGAFVVGLELILNRYLGAGWQVNWSLIACGSSLPPALILLYLRKRLRSREAEIRKVLHL